jgi:hypothetical protein
MSEGLTAKQREAMDHFERAREAGLSLSAYARREGLAVRAIYDTLGAMRRRRARAAAKVKQPSAAPGFVAMRVVSTPPGSSAALCRVQLPAAIVIECREWPPAAWLATLRGLRADAAA